MPHFQCPKGHTYSSSDNSTFCPRCFDKALEEARKKQEGLIDALFELDGKVTTRQIAEKAGRDDVEVVFEVLGSPFMRGLVENLGGNGEECKWISKVNKNNRTVRKGCL